MIDLFQEISDLDTTVIRKTLSVKQDVAQTIKISEKTKLYRSVGSEQSRNWHWPRAVPGSLSLYPRKRRTVCVSGQPNGDTDLARCLHEDSGRHELRKSHRYSTVNKQKDYKMKKRKRKILEKIFENTIVLTRNYEVSPEDSAPFLIKTASALGLLDKKDAKGYLSVLSNKRLD